MAGADRALRVALLTYRGNPRSGGQGVYVNYLSRALIEEGHHVEVFSGPPYPELDPRVPLVRLPSLDLYRAEDPFRRPRRNEFRDWIDVTEYAVMCGAGFPEPLTFSLRAARALASRLDDFDIVHDNQSLGYGLLGIKRRGLPVVATVHHPIQIDRRVEIAHAATRRRKLALRRWYHFTQMQRRVAQRLSRVVTVSGSARDDVVRELQVPSQKIDVVPNGVDPELFHPLPDVARHHGRIVTTASSDVPLKGLVYLIEAVAKLRTEADVELVVVGSAARSGPVRRAIADLGVADCVSFESGIQWLRLVELYAEAEVAVVPSLYEGFSLPAVEAMACGVPVVATSSGALPEVVGKDSSAALLVPPADADALAGALRTLLGDPDLRARMGTAGRIRAVGHFAWAATARATAASYRSALAAC